jgi:hypothetical protein
MWSIFMSYVLTEFEQKIALISDAVKIYITRCRPAVKRNCLPSALNGALAGLSPTRIKLPDLTMTEAIESIVSHRSVPFFSHWSATVIVLLNTPPCLRVREIPNAGGVPAGIAKLT